MVVQPVQPSGAADGGSMVAVDTVGAGAGETVLVLREGRAAGDILGLREPPIRSLIVGIVDRINVAEGQKHHRKGRIELQRTQREQR